MPKMIVQNIGRCLTEYKNEAFDHLKATCMVFYACSQERNLDSWTFKQFQEGGIKETEPVCGRGMRLYGVLPTGQVVKLMEIIDSSD